MNKSIHPLILFLFLAACTSTGPAVTPTSLATTSLPPTHTFTPSPAVKDTPLLTASITPPVIQPVALDPLALNEKNASTGMKRLGIFGTGEPNDLAWSPDGKVFAVATTRGVWLYDGTTLNETGFIDVNDSVSSLAFSSDGEILALAINGKVSLWSIHSGREIREFAGETISVFELAYGSEGQIAALGYKYISYGGPDYVLALWDVSTGDLILSEESIYYQTVALAFSPDGKTLAFGGNTGVKVVKSKTGDLISSNEYQPFALAFSIDGNRLFLVGGENENENKVWDIAQDQISSFIDCSGYLGRADKVGICNNSDQLFLFDLADGRQIGQFDMQIGMSPIKLNPAGDLLAIHNYTTPGITAVRISKVGTSQITPFASLMQDSCWQAVSSGIATVYGKKRYLLAVASGDRQVRLWDIQIGQVVRMLEMDDDIAGLVFSPDQRTLVWLGRMGKLGLWDVESGEVTLVYDLSRRILSGGGTTTSIAISPDGLKLAIVSNTNYLFLANLQAFTPDTIASVSTINGIGQPFLFTPKSHLVVVTYKMGSFSIIDRSTEETLLSVPLLSDNELGLIETIAISSDGRYLAYSQASGQIHVWDVLSHEQISSLKGHEMQMGDGWFGSVSKLAFSPQSNLLVSIGYDGTTRLWNIKTGTELRRLNVCCYADFTPDGRYLVTAGDGVIRVWGIPSP